ncbi:MAG: acyltransferase [Nitrospinae bacterium]|nr:acyltransferase [Nitrospinota bacterium]
MLEISATAKISPLADIEDSARGSLIRIGDGVVIDAFVKIKPVGGTGAVEIGGNSYINSGTVIYSGNGVKIGQNVLIAANVTIAAVNHEYRAREKKIIEQRFMPGKGGVVIEDDVWIGAGAVILDGAIIRRGAVVGALSLVRGELEEYGVYGGNPVQLMGRRE